MGMSVVSDEDSTDLDRGQLKTWSRNNTDADTVVVQEVLG
jgi:hypothetical protein